MAGKRDNSEDTSRREALRAVERAEEQSDVPWSGDARRIAGRVRDHFAAADAAGGGRVEVWGRRVGRTLSLIAVLFLAYYLAATYL